MKFKEAQSWRKIKPMRIPSRIVIPPPSPIFYTRKKNDTFNIHFFLQEIGQSHDQDNCTLKFISSNKFTECVNIKKLFLVETWFLKNLKVSINGTFRRHIFVRITAFQRFFSNLKDGKDCEICQKSRYLSHPSQLTVRRIKQTLEWSGKLFKNSLRYRI